MASSNGFAPSSRDEDSGFRPSAALAADDGFAPGPVRQWQVDDGSPGRPTPAPTPQPPAGPAPGPSVSAVTVLPTAPGPGREPAVSVSSSIGQIPVSAPVITGHGPAGGIPTSPAGSEPVPQPASVADAGPRSPDAAVPSEVEMQALMSALRQAPSPAPPSAASDPVMIPVVTADGRHLLVPGDPRAARAKGRPRGDVGEASARNRGGRPRTKRRRKRDGQAPPQRSPMRVTERDMAILGFLGRYQFATYPQVARYVKTSESAIRHRLPVLRAAGYVETMSVPFQFNLVTVTTAGLRMAGLALPRTVVTASRAAHTLGLVDIGIGYEHRDYSVLTEREIRAGHARGGIASSRVASILGSLPAGSGPGAPHGLFTVPAPKANGSPGQGFLVPDAVLALPPDADGRPQSVAIELELTLKDAHRVDRVIGAYLRHGRSIYSQVLYKTSDTNVYWAIHQTVWRLGAEEFVKIEWFEPSTDLAARP